MLVRIHNQVLCKATENLLVDNLLMFWQDFLCLFSRHTSCLTDYNSSPLSTLESTDHTMETSLRRDWRLLRAWQNQVLEEGLFIVWTFEICDHIP